MCLLWPPVTFSLPHLSRIANVLSLLAGITASPGIIHHAKSISTSSESKSTFSLVNSLCLTRAFPPISPIEGSITKLSDISSQDAPVARLCRVRKFATSPFYGFFLCGDPKKLGYVSLSLTHRTPPLTLPSFQSSVHLGRDQTLSSCRMRPARRRSHHRNQRHAHAQSHLRNHPG